MQTPKNNSRYLLRDRSYFDTPNPIHHYNENTVIRDSHGDIISFNTDSMNKTSKRAEILDQQLDMQEIKNRVTNGLELSVIQEENEESAEAAVFESTLGNKPVQSMLQIVEKNNSISITTTPGDVEPKQRSAVIDVLEKDESGQINIYRKFMAADNWKDLSEEEKKELIQKKFVKNIKSIFSHTINITKKFFNLR